jgi:hypothetical protein
VPVQGELYAQFGVFGGMIVSLQDGYSFPMAVAFNTDFFYNQNEYFVSISVCKTERKNHAIKNICGASLI